MGLLDLAVLNDLVAVGLARASGSADGEGISAEVVLKRRLATRVLTSQHDVGVVQVGGVGGVNDVGVVVEGLLLVGTLVNDNVEARAELAETVAVVDLASLRTRRNRGARGKDIDGGARVPVGRRANTNSATSAGNVVGDGVTDSEGTSRLEVGGRDNALWEGSRTTVAVDTDGDGTSTVTGDDVPDNVDSLTSNPDSGGSIGTVTTTALGSLGRVLIPWSGVRQDGVRVDARQDCQQYEE